MKFFAIALAGLVAAVSAGSYETCEVVTVTKTVTEGYGHTPSAPGHVGPTAPAPYPTTGAPYPSAPAPSGTGYPSVPAPSGTAPVPSGTGSYPVAPPEFTGAASGLKVGGALAGVGAIAALFL